MSIKSQQANMKVIYNLVSQDLSYIHGERESGPNGAKKQFLSKSSSFLKSLGIDLGFKVMKVTTNPGGIAVSGDVTLMGVWKNGNGLYLQISRTFIEPPSFLYRTIKSLKDYNGGRNQWLPCSTFETGDYERLITILSALQKQTEATHHAA